MVGAAAADGGAGDRGGHGATATLGGISLGWTVERLGQAIGEQCRVAPEFLRLIVGEQALDGKESLLLSACRIGAGEITRVHVVPQTAEQAVLRRAAFATADIGAIEEGQAPESAADVAAPAVRRGGGGWCCSGRPTA